MGATTVPESIGSRIDVLLTERGITSYAFAKQIGTSITYVDKLRQGRIQRPSYANLQQMARVLGFPSVEVMLGDAGGDEPIDINTPPVDLLRAAGHSEAFIAELVPLWADQDPAWRLKVITNAKRQVAALQADENLLRAALHRLASVF